jgi:hypothetical protein
VLVIAILSIVGGSLSLLIEGFTLAMQVAGGTAAFTKALTPPTPPGSKAPAVPPDAEAFIKETVPHYSAFLYASLLIGIILSIMMIVGAIGLLRLRPWGRSLSITYAILSLLLKLVGIVYTFMFVIPATNAFFEQHSDVFPPAMLPAMKVGTFVGPILALAPGIYPIVVLVLLTRPSVTAAFRDEEIAEVEPV